MHQFSNGCRQGEHCRIPLLKQYVSQGYWNGVKVDWMQKASCWACLPPELHWHFLQAVHCIGWNNCSTLKQTSSRKDVFFLISVFRLYPGLKMSFQHNFVRKNLFLSACFCWDSGLSLREMDQKFNFGWLIGYGNSCLDSVFRYSKVFRLLAILHDVAGAVRSHNGKGPGYWYRIGWGPNSCLLGHVTGQLFCFHVKLFLSSIFKSVDFWSNMSLIVLEIELTEKNKNTELGRFTDGSLQGFPFCPPKTLNLINRQYGTQVIYMELRRVVESWIMMCCSRSFTTLK